MRILRPLSGPAQQGWAWPGHSGKIYFDILTIFDRTKIKLCDIFPWPFCAKWSWTIYTQNMDRHFLKQKYSSNISWALESWVPDSRGFYVLLPLMDSN